MIDKIGEQYWAWAVSADYAGYGLAYGQTNYGGEHAQTVYREYN
jgi:hypothetical protein